MNKWKMISLTSILLPLVLFFPDLSLGEMKIDINTASGEELQMLYRVGAILSERIVKEREENGDFKSLEDVSARVKGVGPVMISHWADATYLPYSGEGGITSEREAELRELELSLARGEEKLDLNTAPADELQLLYRIGAKIADRIVKEREENGSFTSLKSLSSRVEGVGNTMTEKWSRYVDLPLETEEDLAPEWIDINDATEEELQTLYRVGEKLALRIIEEREKNGSFSSLEDLIQRVKGLGPTIVGNWRNRVVNPLTE